MQFLTKLLRRGAVEPVEMVSKAEYDRLEDRFNNVVAKAEGLGRIINDRDQTCRELSEYPRMTFEVHNVDCYPTDLPGAVQHNAWWDAMALRHKLTGQPA